MDMILDEYKHPLKAVVVEKGYYDRDTGKYVDGTKTEKDFIGAILPLSQDDFIKNPDGGYTRDDKKMYTAEDFKNGQTIYFNNTVYNIDSDMDYNYIDSDFKRYFLKRVGDIDG